LIIQEKEQHDKKIPHTDHASSPRLPFLSLENTEKASSSMSEVARIREQIELTCQAMQLALHGYAAVANHKTITNKYRALGKHQEQLATLVGPEEAERIVVETYNRVMG
jgi:hypothetical protein